MRVTSDGVVLEVGRVVVEHQVAVVERRLRRVIVRIVRVPAGGDQREVADALRVVLLVDVVGDRLELVLEHARLRRLHRLEDAERRQPRRLADQRDLARALDRAASRRAPDRGCAPSSCGACAFSFSMNAASRVGRPSHGSAAVAAAHASDVARRAGALRLGPERRVDGAALLRRAATHRRRELLARAAPARCRSSRPPRARARAPGPRSAPGARCAAPRTAATACPCRR